jgi:threonine dehydrogenase-like Zn-dependent dehydrogenase
MRAGMRALTVRRTLKFDRDYPKPPPRPGESLIRVRMAGICGTDLELVRGYMTFEGVPGHEFVGEVAETNHPDLAGKRVVGEINASCGACEQCASGLGRHCSRRTVLGILGRDGAFAEYLTLPDRNLFVVPDSIADEAAVFVEPLAAAYEILDQLSIPRDQKIAVLGDGRLGAIVALALRAEGLKPIVAGHHRGKLARLEAIGIATSLEAEITPGVDVVVDCTGSHSGLRRAAELVKPRGTIVLKSTAAGSSDFNLAPLVINEITVIGSRCGRFAPALAALASGRIEPRPLISEVLSLDDGVAAFARADEPPNFKILLRVS